MAVTKAPGWCPCNGAEEVSEDLTPENPIALCVRERRWQGGREQIGLKRPQGPDEENIPGISMDLSSEVRVKGSWVGASPDRRLRSRCS